MNLTIEQIVAQYGFSHRTVRRLIKENRIPPIETRGRQKLYDPELIACVLTFLRKPKVRPGARKQPSKEVDQIVREHTQPEPQQEPTLLERVKQLEEDVRRLEKLVGVRSNLIPDEIVQIFRGVEPNI